MSVAKFIELSGQSSQGYEDAIRQAVQRASSTIRNITSVWAKELEAVVENNQVTQFRVVVKIAFVMDEAGGAGGAAAHPGTRAEPRELVERPVHHALTTPPSRATVGPVRARSRGFLYGRRPRARARRFA